jgi:ABC-2 type transport system ATP-binding protein
MERFAVDVQDMTKKFGDRIVVDQISLQIAPGEIFGFLGPNGSGKTTFIRMLCGLLRSDGGSGRVLDYDVIAESSAIKKEVGYMTQRFSFYEDLSIEENLEFVARMYEMPDIRGLVTRSLENLGLINRRQQLAGELSGGWKQRLALAACLIHDPRLLLLDEPTAGVDPRARRDFWDQVQALAARGLTVLVTTHYMDEAERCNRIAYISKGKLLTVGTVPEVIASARLKTFEVRGSNLVEVAERLRGAAGVEHAVAFGTTLHVSGSDATLLQSSLEVVTPGKIEWHEIPSSLEDVFIHLMDSNVVASGRP